MTSPPVSSTTPPLLPLPVLPSPLQPSLAPPLRISRAEGDERGGDMASPLVSSTTPPLLPLPILPSPLQLSLAPPLRISRAEGDESGGDMASVERLASLLRQAVHADLFERPARRILEDTGKALDKATTLLDRCRGHNLIRLLLQEDLQPV
ncbi:Os11g0549400 [Oryza sativa Japonica Group]|uniref:DUF7792 domain-containing protein n=2 Tax=Oryza sativa subsp. japonica TaxID=39947 RepID=A0A8J8YRS3_ORYSJ|nr:hypothetical protein OsJ_34206 [Oryza sativa Japonica Group]BAT14395.1 Os11g0549400 [Oryza sativa Japonica Group]